MHHGTCAQSHLSLIHISPVYPPPSLSMPSVRFLSAFPLHPETIPHPKVSGPAADRCGAGFPEYLPIPSEMAKNFAAILPKEYSPKDHHLKLIYVQALKTFRQIEKTCSMFTKSYCRSAPYQMCIRDRDIDEKDREDALEYYRDYMDEAGISEFAAVDGLLDLSLIHI